MYICINAMNTGIQHFIFIDLVRQIEGIANDYLSVLAEGGIQLSLSSTSETVTATSSSTTSSASALGSEKIVKSVFVRTADGRFQERGLAQLSGGQWRRVSMALDLAFTEVVRRRGTLRSNFMVMDEVCTRTSDFAM